MDIDDNPSAAGLDLDEASDDEDRDPNSLNNNELSIGFIGAGNMAKSIAFPLFELRKLNPTTVRVSATSDRNLKDWRDKGCITTTSNLEIIRNCNTIIWAVKPQIFPQVLAAIPRITERNPENKQFLHISIMAGITLDSFTNSINSVIDSMSTSTAISMDRFVRCMPNIGLKVRTGVTVFTMKPNIANNYADREIVKKFFEPNGLVYEVEEAQMNAYCALFGSGIGFMFPIINAMSDGAVQMGIPRDRSFQIIAQVMKGAGELVQKTGIHPAALQDSVCSPGGTTIAGIVELESFGVRNAFIQALKAAKARGEELGQPRQ